MKRKTGIISFTLRAFLAMVLVVVVIMNFTPPPNEIPFSHPQAKGKYEKLTYDFWGAFQTGSTWAVADSECGTNHGWPENSEAPDFEPVESDREHRFANIICRMEAALEEDPHDETLPNVLAAAYSWRAATNVKPEHTERDLHEARHHAGQAVKLGNVLAGGFESAPTWYLGFIMEDQGKPESEWMPYKEAAYEQMIKDTLEFASFHGYVEGVMLSAMLNPEEPEEKFDYFWAHISYLENIEACFWGQNKLLRKIQFPQGMRVNDLMMNIVARISVLTGRGYCYNNGAVPFNMPGLYIAQGDAYLKNGKMEYAQVAYENALRAPNAANWQYADQVRIRLNDMEGIRKKFIEDSFKFRVDQKPTAMVGQAEWFCAGCHQWSGADPDKRWTNRSTPAVAEVQR